MISQELLPVPPAVLGGAVELYIDSVAARLAGRFDVTVISPRLDSTQRSEHRAGVNHVRLAGFEDQVAYFQNVAEYLSGSRWDIVELFNRPTYAKLIRRVCPGAKVMHSLHNDL